ncbi:putative quinol monooxygenase [Crenobacter intestini]|uniref:Antibiotic biosynthesis monooxygenase n=1 Tax=Crenobacter intestini TaxID=2563443 RepID=A0A4T0UVT3_9NEIS|nr:putative quinol monooxygenase [Crenobacter intestini]TIC83048.1 antibiotic biosynthesis monooxygenase [Crenobacter intestini]
MVQSSEVFVTAQFRVRPGQEEAMRSLLNKLAEATRTEAGCLSYRYCQSTTEPLCLTSIEHWQDGTAEAAHWKTPHLQEALIALGGLMDGEAEVHRYRPFE